MVILMTVMMMMMMYGQEEIKEEMTEVVLDPVNKTTEKVSS